jgi:hypothetical protein
VKSFPVQSSFQWAATVAESELSSGSKCLDFLQRIVSNNKYRKSQASPHNFSSAKEMMGGHHAWAVCIVNEFEKTSWNHQSVPLVMVLRKICLLRQGLSMILAAPATGVKLLRIQDLWCQKGILKVAWQQNAWLCTSSPRSLDLTWWGMKDEDQEDTATTIFRHRILTYMIHQKWTSKKLTSGSTLQNAQTSGTKMRLQKLHLIPCSVLDACSCRETLIKMRLAK